MTSSTRPSRDGFQVRVAADRAQQLLPAQADVFLGGVRPAEGRQDAGLPVLPAGDHRPPFDAQHGGPDGLPHVHVGVADNQDVPGGARGGHHGVGDPRLLGVRHQVVHQDAEPPAGPGRKSATAPARSSMPCRGSTTMPSTRRSSPQTFSTSSASCLPSTQIRLALATWARWPATRTEPDAVRPAAAAAAPAGAPAASAGWAGLPAGTRIRAGRNATCRAGPRGPPHACRRTSPPGSPRPPSRTGRLRGPCRVPPGPRAVRSWRARRSPAGPSSGTAWIAFRLALDPCPGMFARSGTNANNGASSY